MLEIGGEEACKVENIRRRFQKWKSNNTEKLKKLNKKIREEKPEEARQRLRDWRGRPVSKKTQNFFLALQLGETIKKHNKMKLQPKSQSKICTAQELASTFTGIMNQMEVWCQNLAATNAVNPNILQELMTVEPRFKYNQLASLLMVGRGELLLDLLYDDSTGARKLLAMPVEIQRKLYKDQEPIMVARIIGGKTVVEPKVYKRLSPQEQNLVIDQDNKRLRTVEEQIPNITPARPARIAVRYKIIGEGERLHVLAETEFERERLREILENMDALAVKALPESMKSNQLR